MTSLIPFATFVFFLISSPINFGESLFEYVCDEKLLYKPYVHVYKDRRGERLHDYAPGFHVLTYYKNVYICINGIVFLYFSKTTELGEVYEAPQMKKYAHHCEMYNVQPREGAASIMEVQLHLRGVLLLGDPEDYRLPSIQKFTAPYYFRRDQLNPKLETDPDYHMMPAHHINASSVIIIGQSECTLTKGPNKVLIKVRPHIFPAGEDKEVEESYICKIGYLSLLEKATTPTGGPVPSMEDRGPALALLNDEAIRVDNCISTPQFSKDEAGPVFESLEKEVETFKKEYEEQKTDHITKFNELVDNAILNTLKQEEKKLEEKLEQKEGKEPLKEKEKKKVEKQLELIKKRIAVEEEKKTAYEKDLDALITQIGSLTELMGEAKPDGSKASTADTDKQAADKAKEEYDNVKDQKPPKPETEVQEKKTEYEKTRRKARDSARDYIMAVSDLQVGVARVKQMAERFNKLKSHYSPTSERQIRNKESGKKSVKVASSVNPEGTMAVVITANETECEKLPVLEGDEGECKKGKPDQNKTCSIFKALLGTEDPWNLTDTTNGDDTWKKEVLELIGDIFAKACDRIPDVDKLTKLINNVMGFYLTNDKIFNQQPDFTTDTCINFKFAKNLKILGAGGNNASTPNMELKNEKGFWSTIKFALHEIFDFLEECEKENRKLAFKEVKPSEKYHFVRDFGGPSEKEHEIVVHNEQADTEYIYNWVIDMNWKMFVTILGLCMPGYEQKIPLITSRFFSMYTESFLIPLRETWTNPKDNILFQFLLGEFYNDGETEMWTDLCMESSFIYSEQRDYRPPRSLLVNCASEHNYFQKQPQHGHFSKVNQG